VWAYVNKINICTGRLCTVPAAKKMGVTVASLGGLIAHAVLIYACLGSNLIILFPLLRRYPSVVRDYVKFIFSFLLHLSLYKVHTL
jgi:hypothetical protein